MPVFAFFSIYYTCLSFLARSRVTRSIAILILLLFLGLGFYLQRNHFKQTQSVIIATETGNMAAAAGDITTATVDMSASISTNTIEQHDPRLR